MLYVMFRVVEVFIVGILLLLTFSIIERVRFSSGKEMLVDKILVFLESVHNRELLQRMMKECIGVNILLQKR